MTDNRQDLRGHLAVATVVAIILVLALVVSESMRSDLKRKIIAVQQQAVDLGHGEWVEECKHEPKVFRWKDRR